MRTSGKSLIVTIMLFCLAPRAQAYVDLASTLGRIMRDAQTISVVEVDKFSREKGAIILTKVRDLKGTSSAEPIRQQVTADGGTTVPRPILEWAEPGRRGVMFTAGNAALVCIGRSWYQVQASTGGWWKLGATRPDLPLAYCGTVSRLADAVQQMLLGKTAVITTVSHGADDEAASFDLALNRSNLPGLVKSQRVRASLQMPQNVMAMSNAAYVIGQGVAAEEEIASLIENLKSADATTRAESADDLRTLGTKAKAAISALAGLLSDPAAAVRMSAAAALANIIPSDALALHALSEAMSSPDALVRRHAARAAGLAGASAGTLAPKLAELLTDSDQLVRLAALESIATLGPAAAGARDAVVKLLDEPQAAADAADALGRMGPAARPAQKRLAELLKSESSALRWAAVRAMSQIGGDDAAPAVAFMIRELPKSSELDGYNMMIYLGLLGPVAKEAIPAVMSAPVKQPALRPAALWAIEPDKRFPWLGGGGRFGGPGGMEGDVTRFIYEAYVSELGDHLRPASRALAQKIMDGTAGEMPMWAYRVLARFPEEAMPILTPALGEKDIVKRERAVVALGYMGTGASAAKEPVATALRNAPTEREQKLLKWCLREIGG